LPADAEGGLLPPILDLLDALPRDHPFRTRIRRSAASGARRRPADLLTAAGAGVPGRRGSPLDRLRPGKFSTASSTP
jgi:hypothetical protein